MEDFEAVLETGGAAAVELAVAALLERGGKVTPCPNCGEPMIGEYCGVCGQPRETHRRSVVHLLHDLVKDIASFDSRILRTVRALVAKPGELPLAFREGRTQRYVPAVRLYLFVSLLFFLFLSATGIAFVQFDMKIDSFRLTTDAAGNVVQVRGNQRTVMSGFKATPQGNVYIDTGSGGARIPVPVMKADGSTTDTITSYPRFFERIGADRPHYSTEQLAALAEARAEILTEAKKANGNRGWLMRTIFTTLTKLETDPAALNGPMMAWIPRILFLLLPLFALLLAAFYRRQRRDFLFVDHMVFSLTAHTFAFVALVAAAILAQIIAGTWVALLTALVLAAYLLLSLKRFYKQNWTKTGLKFVGIAVAYTVFLLTPALAGALVASVLAT